MMMRGVAFAALLGMASAQNGPWQELVARDPKGELYDASGPWSNYDVDKDHASPLQCGACNKGFGGNDCLSCDNSWKLLTDASNFRMQSGITTGSGGAREIPTGGTYDFSNVYSMHWGWWDEETGGDLGTKCDIFCDPFTTCNGNGYCDFTAGNVGKCVCMKGFSGTACDVCLAPTPATTYTDVRKYGEHEIDVKTLSTAHGAGLHAFLPLIVHQNPTHSHHGCGGSISNTPCPNVGSGTRTSTDQFMSQRGKMGKGCDSKCKDEDCNGNGVCAAEAFCGKEKYDPGTHQCCMFTSTGFFADPAGDQQSNGPTEYDDLRANQLNNGPKGAWVPEGWMHHYTADVGKTCCGIGLACNPDEHTCYGEAGGLQTCRDKFTGAGKLCNQAEYTNGTRRMYGTGTQNICKPDVEECCDGTCCDTNAGEVCTEHKNWQTGVMKDIRNRDATYMGFQTTAYNAFGFANGKVPSIDAGYTSSFCAKDTLTDLSAMRIVALPLFLIIAFVAGTVLVMLGRPASSKATLGCVWGVVFCSIMLIFSTQWQLAVLLVFGAWVALLASGSGYKHAGTLSTIVTVTILFQFIGTTTWLDWFVGNSDAFDDLKLQVGLTGYTSNQLGGWVDIYGQQGQCANYYNYFKIETESMNGFDEDNMDVYFGYCTGEWLTAIEFFKIVLLCLYIYLVTASAGGLWKPQGK